MTETPTALCARCGSRVASGRFDACPRCLLEAPLPPAELGDALELIEEIGSGGMGSVWKAQHRRLGRTVAVKFLSAELAAIPEFAARFVREAQAQGRLNHPGIVAVHDFGEDDGRPYIVMEYVDGRPLSESLPLPPARAHQVALELLDALSYAHTHGIVHRDVKPQNVLLDAQGRVKVSDFGIARVLGGDPGLTATGRVLGTPAYMAPEALAGAPVDPRMDVYAAGVVLHEMAPGPVFAEIVRRATARDPRERYASALEMQKALAAVAMSPRLPPEEQPWLRSVALVQTLATAAVLWALLLSVTPRVISGGERAPLIMLRTEELPDGRFLSSARFETWPTLAAVGFVTLALVSQALLRRHWRQAGLDHPQPDRGLSESAGVTTLGAVAVTIYVVRRLLMPPGFWTSYVPLVGGLLELTIVFLFWTAVLEAWRRSRPLRREPLLWTGALLALVPPVADFLRYLHDWKP